MIPFVLLMSKKSAKKSAFFGKYNTFTQNNGMRTVLETFLVLFSVFVR